jgi:hypothetical protein
MSFSNIFFGIFLSCLCSGNILCAQQPAIEWQKSLGGTGTDVANCIIQTTDGGYITAGSAGSNDGDVSGYHGVYTVFDDCWIVKMNSLGIVEWKKCLGGSANDRAYSIVQTTDGGYLIAGETSSVDGDVINSNTFNQCWIVKINSTGSIQWQKAFGGYGQSSARYITPTTDGGYIVSATTSAADGDVTFNHGGSDIWILKLSNAGNIQWQKCYGGSRDEYAKEIHPTTDGGYIIMGNTASADGDVTGYHEGIDYGLFTRYRTDAWVVKITSTGILEWQQTMGGTAWDAGNSIVQGGDGGYVFTGFTQSTDGNVTVPVSGGENTIWIVKLSNTGNVAWQKNYGGIQFQQGNCIKNTADGGYIVAAEALPNPLADPASLSCNTLGVQDYWILKTDAAANLQWQQTYGSNGNDFAYSLQQTADGGYIVAGMGAENSGDIISKHFSDFWIIKLRQASVPSIIIQTSDSVICAGAEVTFTAAISFGGVTPVYQWKKNGISVGTNTDTYITSGLSNQDTVYCLLTTKASCTASIAQSVISNAIVETVTGTIKPAIKITGSNSICAGTPVNFGATISNAGPDAVFQWQVNGNIISGEKIPATVVPY